MAVVKEYFKYTRDLENDYGKQTIVLMQVGAFFEAYGLKSDTTKTDYENSNIFDYANLCELKIAEKQPLNTGEHYYMAGFRDYSLDKYLKKLHEANYTVAVYKQDEKATGTTRSLLGIYSPGTYFPKESSQITNSISCIWLVYSSSTKKYVIGLSNIDVITGTSNIYEFYELSNSPSFDQIERFISINKPNEIIFIHHDKLEVVNKIIQYCDFSQRSHHIIDLYESSNNNDGSNNTKRAKNCENQTYQFEIFNKFYYNFTLTHELFEYTIAIQSICFLLDWIWRHNPNLVHNIQPPIFENYSNHMILANHSLKQLNIINDSSLTNNSSLSCVNNLLNQCNTAMGKRKTYFNLTHPATDFKELNNVYSITEYLIQDIYESNTSFTTISRMKLATIQDIDKFNRKLIHNTITPNDIYKLYNDLINTIEIYDNCEKNDTIYSHLFPTNNETGHDFRSYVCTLITMINSTFDIVLCNGTDSSNDVDFNFIKNGFDANHDSLVKKYQNTNSDIANVQIFLSDIIGVNEKKKDKNNKSFISLNNTDKHGYVFTCTKRRGVLLTENIKNTGNRKDANLFLNSLNKALNTIDILTTNGSAANTSNISNIDIRNLFQNASSYKINMAKSQSEIFKIFCHHLSDKSVVLQSISTFITKVDFISNIAYISHKYNYCKPTIINNDEKSFFHATSIRHPLIENLLHDELYVTNNINFDKDNKGYLLFGTNAVGKSSFIKSIGISIIMAQAGFFVPCSTFSYFPYKKIFTRIIGNDNIFKGLSTFAVEMLEFKNIIENCCENSIVLGDELCSGTETDSAISIILAGIDYLYKNNTSYIFATHFHEIVSYSEIEDKKTLQIKHMSIQYDTENDKLIYNRKLTDGPGDSMYGLEVCKGLHLPSSFLTSAHEIRNKYNKKGQSILDYEKSKYNSKKLKGGLCEFCNKNISQEVHHLQYQKDANISNGYINDDFNKNHIANLMNICGPCHDEIHKLQKKMTKKKTTNGTILRTHE
jgi:DNA mismatch repair protein MutS